MSEIKKSSLDKKIAQFFENTTELLTDIHARNKRASIKDKLKAAPKKERGMKKPISKIKPNVDVRDKEPSGR